MRFIWPDPREIGAFTLCACGRGTWVRYKGIPACYWCATGETPPPPTAARDPLVVTFTEAEAARIREVAGLRGSRKRAHGVRDQKIDAHRDDFTLDHAALRVYCAAAKALGVTPLLDVSLRGSAGYLLHTERGTVQTRSSVHGTGHLLFNTLDRIRGDVIVFGVAGLLDAVELLGWITAREFRAQHLKQDFGYGERLRVAQSALHPMSELVPV